MTFRGAEQRFLLLFLEKEEPYITEQCFIGGTPPSPLGPLRGLWVENMFRHQLAQ
jgi:hypothetical protein